MRFILASLILMITAVFIPAALAEPVAAEPIKVLICGKDFATKIPPSIINGAVYVPFSVVKALGAEVSYDWKRKRDWQPVKISSAEGKTQEVKGRLVNNEMLVSIVEIAPGLLVAPQWDDATKTLDVQAQVQSIDFDGLELRISTSLPVEYKVAWWKAENRLIVHMDGVKMPDRQALSSLVTSSGIPIRVGRDVVLDMPNPVTYRVLSAVPRSSIIEVSISGLDPSYSGPAVQQSYDSTGAPLVVETPPVDITSMNWSKTGPREIQINIGTASGIDLANVQTSILRRPSRLVLDIDRAVLPKPLDEVSAKDEILLGLRAGQKNNHSVRVVLDLTRAVCFDVRQDAAGIVVVLQLPKNAGGKLADKTIVIDPGHGGKFAGAPGAKGKSEKAYNLEIATRVQKLLADAGACALLTRKSDVDLNNDKTVDLRMRTDFAFKHSADLFVSIHCNSSWVAGSRSGSETYYRRGDQSSRALAYSIHPEVIEATGLPDCSVRADSTLPGGGLAVLRNSSKGGLPAVLVEVGFLNHPTDMALISGPASQQKIAEAIVRGIKAYIEGVSGETKGSTDAGPKAVKAAKPAVKAKPAKVAAKPSVKSRPSKVGGEPAAKAGPEAGPPQLRRVASSTSSTTGKSEP